MLGILAETGTMSLVAPLVVLTATASSVCQPSAKPVNVNAPVAATNAPT